MDTDDMGTRAKAESFSRASSQSSRYLEEDAKLQP
jgi:hypothetical protein